MSSLNPIQTPQAPTAIGPYSQAVRLGDWLFISGQIPLDPTTGTLVEGDIIGQTHQVMRNLEAILIAAQGSFQNLVQTTLLLADISDFPVVNDLYASYLSPPYPARTTFQAAALPKGARIEIAAIAHIDLTPESSNL